MGLGIETKRGLHQRLQSPGLYQTLERSLGNIVRFFNPPPGPLFSNHLSHREEEINIGVQDCVNSV